ncbi:precorrin-3B C(17)-methyltransferase [Mastigocoleus sp. MO_188.B34]|uniref:precorrin-3B C(17)-methyltransferase n=1 Tax=Mastigocoleus sp. MO_188.B34 TaxID=3036635 RepID=UPI002607D1A6|nr:precorrin-3B C(17)-methyltransferase [Mastigocoleus sp. MO_188.B34]MDJ0692879.1 precorrin-3B C(17)-methyltransferase [Mastigocoleus sp. MO_188.B34]
MLLAEFAPLALIAIASTGINKLQSLCVSSSGIPKDSATIWVPESCAGITGTQVYNTSLKKHVASLWYNQKAFVFCLATGAVVRLIAPLLGNKSSDPAVLVIDEKGQFVISLCGGHQGGGDRLAQLIATKIGATPILTGASASLELPAVDMLGVPFGWCRGKGDWTAVSASVVRGEPVQVVQEAGSTIWRTAKGVEKSSLCFEETVDTTAKIWITYKSFTDKNSTHKPSTHKSSTQNSPFKLKDQNYTEQPEKSIVTWYPKVLWVGIGCERGTPRKVIEAAIKNTFQEYQLAKDAIAGIATIDIKSDEVGLVELCANNNLPLRTFSREILKNISVPNPSQIVAKEVGTPSVAEAAALLAALIPSHTDKELTDKELTEEILNSSQGKTKGEMLIPKQIFRLEGQPGAVTVAVTKSEREYTGRKGKILLVGTGPGELQQITPAAKTAIASVDAVIGYGLYLDLISPLLRTGQIIEALPITKERQRAQRAIELANWGLSVAVVSSGDCGIYGMAGLVLEELQVCGWDGKTPGIEIFPGITALQAAASRVGTPLMHDFCAISLSDLLTPWEVIEKRLQAAAAADFVTALYNPKSKTRTEQLTIATNIFLQHRNPNTTVAVVRSAYREDEQITITTLDKLLDVSVDMLTIVLIGNQSTRNYCEWMITPRGYIN